jgi:hypothetical protein
MTAKKRPRKRPSGTTQNDRVYRWAGLVVRLVTVVIETIDRHWR